MRRKPPPPRKRKSRRKRAAREPWLRPGHYQRAPGEIGQNRADPIRRPATEEPSLGKARRLCGYGALAWRLADGIAQGPVPRRGAT